jgi:hypothetical protein
VQQEMQQGETRLETAGDPVELSPDGTGERAFSGNGAEGKNCGDKRVLNQIGPAVFVQKTLRKLFRTVHLDFS